MLVVHIGVPSLRTDEFEWVTFAKQQTLRCEVIESRVCQLASTVNIVRVSKQLTSGGEAEGACDRVINVAGLDAYKSIEEL